MKPKKDEMILTAAALIICGALIALNAVQSPPLSAVQPAVVVEQSSESEQNIIDEQQIITQALPDSQDRHEQEYPEYIPDQPNQEVHVPQIKENPPNQTVQETPPDDSTDEFDASDPYVDINKAAEQELAAKLPGVGPVLASRIVEYREANGDFSRPEDLLNVKGIGEVKLSNMIHLIYFD